MNTVLAYPYFFPTTLWFRVAALCWDRVYTLRTSHELMPGDIAELDRTFGGMLQGIDVRRFSSDAAVKAGFVDWLALNKRSLGAPEAFGRSQFVLLNGLFPSSEEFEEFCEQLKQVGLFQPGRHHRALLPTWEDFEPRLLYPEAVVTEDNSGRDDYFHALAAGNRRLAAAIRRAWKPRRRRTAMNHEAASEVVFVPPEIPLHFLALCATKAAEAENTDLAATGRAYVETALFGVRNLAAHTATTLVQAVLPEGIDSLDIGLLADIRELLSLQRFKYQADIRALCNEIAAASSQGTLHLMQERALDLAMERYNETKSIYRNARIETVTKAFALTLGPPALASSIASLLGVGMFVPMGVATAVAAFAAQRLAASSEATSKVNDRGWSYLLHLSRWRRRWWRRLWQ